jgi:hypothetical protein
MFGTIRRYEAIDQNRTNELVKKAEDTLLPRLSELPGFNGYYLIEASRSSRPPSRIRRRSPTDKSSCTRPASS